MALPIVAVAAGPGVRLYRAAMAVHPRPSPAIGGPGQGPGTLRPPQPVCGKPILDSRWHYDGAPGTSPPGMNPLACPPSARPAATSPPPPRSSLCRLVTTRPPQAPASTTSTTPWSTSNPVSTISRTACTPVTTSAYVGGYTAAGEGHPRRGGRRHQRHREGRRPARNSTPSSGNNVYDTWEYLTIRNFTSSLNSSVMGNVNGGAGGSDIGDVYEYDTIGPNEYGYQGDNAAPKTGESSGGGYAIDAGSNTTIEHDCLTRNAQGAFNISERSQHQH